MPRELETPSRAFISATEQIGLHWWYWDLLNKLIHVSPGLEILLGYGPGEFDLHEASLYKNIHPDDVEENYRRMRRLISGESPLYEMEYRLKDGQGNWKWFYNRGSIASREEDGSVRYVGGITMDISGQFRQMAAKLEEKEKFEFIFRNTGEAIMTFEMEEDKAGKVVDANQAAMDLFGKGPGDLNKVLPEPGRSHELVGERGELFRQVLRDGYGHVERKFMTADGTERWLDFSAHAFSHKGKNLAMVIISDMTVRKMTEAALKGSERLYRTLFDAADDPIGLFTMEREIIIINRAFYGAFGYTRSEFFDLGLLEIIHPDDRCVLEAKWEEFLKEGILLMEYRCRHKEGHYLHVSSKNVIIKGDPGEKDLILTIIRDLTHRRRAMEELKRAKRRAEESDRLKSAFLANMSHEIRTPMNSIVGFSNLLVNPGLDADTRAMYVNRIVRNSELLLALISDIIDLAKIESGQLPLILGTQVLGAFLSEMKQCAEEEMAKLGKTDIELVVENHCGDLEIRTDVLRLNQIMKNLVSNAIKFTDRGSVTIGCASSEKEGHVILFVKDTGIGISGENFDLIFDQFRQLDGSNTRKFGGTGLGLAISKNLADMMGGTIRVKSQEGDGSHFMVDLPLEPDQTRFTVQKEIPQQSRKPGSRARLNILVVDDEKDSADLFREILQSSGHSIATAPSGYEALRILEKNPRTDLVFMDVRMPVLSGTDTMKIMKSRYKGIRVVAQSAHALVGDRARFIREGFDDYLAKPFSAEQITGILDRLS